MFLALGGEIRIILKCVSSADGNKGDYSKILESITNNMSHQEQIMEYLKIKIKELNDGIKFLHY